MANKNVVVTGGAMGIGKAIVERFVKEGYDVIIADFAEDKMAETKAEMEAKGATIHTVKCDISNLDNVKAVKEYIEKEYGYLTVLVNNAGISPGGDAKELSLNHDVFDRIMTINVYGPYNMIITMRELLLKAKEMGQDAAIVNVASTAAFTGGGGSVGYAAGKGAVVSMTRSFARYFGDEQVRINAVAPTLIMTPLMEERFKDDPEGLERRTNSVPIKRWQTVDEVADVVYFLSQPSFLHGETIVADGGRSYSI